MNVETIAGAVLLLIAGVGFGLLMGYQFGWVNGQNAYLADIRDSHIIDPSDRAGA